MKKILSLLILIWAGQSLMAQVPVISSIERITKIPTTKLFINGSGFDSDPARMKVWFGAQEGQVVSATGNSLEVVIPVGATADNITVINLTSRKSWKSPQKFYPFFSGDGFDPNLVRKGYWSNDAAWYLDLTAVDFNRDKKTDIAVSNYTSSLNTIDIFLNTRPVPPNGTVTFNPDAYKIGVTDLMNDVVHGDLNNDGWPDLVFTQGGDATQGSDRYTVYVAQNSNGSFPLVQKYFMEASSTFTEKIQIRDLDNDGLPELIVSNSKTPELFIFRNTSNGAVSFVTKPIAIPIPGVTTPFGLGLEVQDLNGDRKPELIFTGQDTGASSNVIRVLPNTTNQAGGFSFGAPVHVENVQILFDLVTGDFNRDGLLDIASSTGISGKIAVNINTSSGNTISFDSKKEFTASGSKGMDIGDVDGDGWLDIVSSNYRESKITVLENRSDGGSFNMNSVSVDVDYPSSNIRVADMDGDGKPDFVLTATVGAGMGYNTEVYLNKNCTTPIIFGETSRYICSNQTIRLQTFNIPGATYIWNQGGKEIKNSAENFVDITAIGDVTVTMVQGSCSETSNVINFISGTGTVPGDPAPQPVEPSCIGGEVQLSAPSVNGASYKWSGPNGFTSDLQNPKISNIQPGDAGIYTLVVSIGQCQSSEGTVLVDVISFPAWEIVSSTGDGFCEGTSSELSLPSDPNYTYSWKKDGAAIGSGGPVLPITAGGQYEVVVTHTAQGCSTVYTKNVQATNLPVLDPSVSKNTPCVSEVVPFSANAVLSSGVQGSYLWDFGDGVKSDLENPEHGYAAAGSYTVTLTVGYVGMTACQSTATLVVNVTNAVKPVITADKNPVCPGDTVKLNVQTGTYTSVDWWYSVDKIARGTGESISTTDLGKYFVTTMDNNNCVGQSDTLVILSNEVPLVIATPSDTTIAPGSEVQLLVEGTADSYIWAPATDLNDSSIVNPLASPTSSITYIVTGTLNLTGCTASDTVRIKVDVGEGVPMSLIPAKVITPNSDGTNDFWTIEGIENYPGATIMIMDRRGMLLREFVDYDNLNGFDGTDSSGNLLPPGAYYFIVRAVDSFYIPYKGSILLVR